VGRFRLVLPCVALLALAVVGAALGGNGGFAPQAPADSNESGIRTIYWVILAFTGAIFVIVETALILFMARYRSRGRPREIEGVQIRGHTNLELAWTVAPVVLLAVIAGVVFWKAGGIRNAPAALATDRIRIEGHQYYWQFVYPNGAISIDTLRVPYGRRIQLEITAADVVHSWWVPALGGKMDAIPGRINTTSFRPAKLGTFRGQCAEFCGIQHTAMLNRVEVLPAREYDAWVRQRRASRAAVGRDTFVGVCAKCHGLAGQGMIGPPIAQSPLLADRAALSTLIREGRGKMPAVGSTWSDAQLNATIAYLRKRFAGGGGGG
jgi:cytochrome c oxidase subunit 2